MVDAIELGLLEFTSVFCTTVWLEGIGLRGVTTSVVLVEDSESVGVTVVEAPERLEPNDPNRDVAGVTLVSAVSCFCSENWVDNGVGFATGESSSSRSQDRSRPKPKPEAAGVVCGLSVVVGADSEQVLLPSFLAGMDRDGVAKRSLILDLFGTGAGDATGVGVSSSLTSSKLYTSTLLLGAVAALVADVASLAGAAETSVAASVGGAACSSFWPG